MAALLLVAHGSRNQASNNIVRALARACAERLPEIRVVASFLEHPEPRPADALRALAAAGVREVVAAPLLFTSAYHVNVDLPRELDAALQECPELLITTADALAPHDALLDLLDARLAQALRVAGEAQPPDALVLTSAGTSDAAARDGIGAFGEQWAQRHGLPLRAAFASAAEPDPGQAVAALRAGGARRVAVGSLFLGPGFLPSRARRQALDAGAVAVSRHLACTPETVTVVVDRYRQAVPR